MWPSLISCCSTIEFLGTIYCSKYNKLIWTKNGKKVRFLKNIFDPSLHVLSGYRNEKRIPSDSCRWLLWVQICMCWLHYIKRWELNSSLYKYNSYETDDKILFPATVEMRSKLFLRLAVFMAYHFQSCSWNVDH